METMHSCPSGASQGNPISHSNLRLHHHFQHHPSPAPDILSPTGKSHEHPTHKQLPNPTSLTPIHPLHHTHLPSPSLRDLLRTPHAQGHRQGIRHLPTPTHRGRPLHRHLLHGLSCSSGEQEEELGHMLKQANLHILGCTPVHHLWGFRDVYSCGSH